MYKDLFSVDLINLQINAKSIEKLFEIVGNELYQKGYVQRSYTNALLERELEFPTGLITKFVNIALPHTDPEHIKKPFVYVVKNEAGLDMRQMGDNEIMSVKYLFFLGITDPTSQVGLLAKFMELFSDERFVSLILEEEKEKEIIDLFVNNI